MTAILCRIVWMGQYNGPEEFHPGGMQWDDDENVGEAWNFLPGNDSIVRGFTMLTARNREGELTGTINIDRLGANPNDKYIEGITVIFYTPHPNDGNVIENVIVGWYENTKVYRHWKIDEIENEYRK